MLITVVKIMKIVYYYSVKITCLLDRFTTYEIDFTKINSTQVVQKFHYTVVAKKDKTTLLVKLLTKSFYPFWPLLYDYEHCAIKNKINGISVMLYSTSSCES